MSITVSPRTLVIINNVAARAGRAWPAVERALIENGINFDAHVTARPGDATAATRAALRANYQIIAVVGGDGTLSEAAAGFFESAEERTGRTPDDFPEPINADAALAILPAGTGDDFARGLVGKRESLGEWVKRLVAHCRGNGSEMPRPLDVIYGSTDAGARRFICLNVASIGLGAEVAKRVAAQGGLMLKMSGEARFVSAALGALAAWRERSVRVTIDESRATECTSNLIAVANGVYTGGGMMFAPTARADDGLMNVLIACGVTRATILRELPRIRRGAHLTNPNVKSLQATRVRIETGAPQDALLVEADGNVRGRTPAEFHVMPGALRVVV